MRLLIAFMIVLGAAAVTLPSIAQDVDDDYEQYLRDYDQRVAESQRLEAEQRWKRWTPFLIISGILFIYLAYSQISTRRRYGTAMAKSQQGIDQSLKQNQEMIELLRSINERLENTK